MGRYGQKTGAGWYDYKPGDRKPYPSQWVNDMIIKHSKEIGVERRKISDQEIVERLVYALVNEAAYILEEGIAQRASDIDMVYLTGYGFPAASRRPDVLCRHGGPVERGRGDGQCAQGRHGEVLETRAAAGEACRRRQDVQLSC